MAWYTTGTIAVSGTTVTGTGTNFLDNTQSIGPGQALLIPGSGTVKMYEVASVQSATKLTLKTTAGTVAAGQAYAILSFYTDSVPDFARRLAAQLSYYQSQMDGWQQIMTGTGSITMTAPDGTTVTISSFSKLTADIASAIKIMGAITTAVDINSYGPTSDYIGIWRFSSTAGYQSANLPEANSGILEVTNGGDYGGMQRYTSGSGNVYVRTLSASWNATTTPWKPWIQVGRQTPRKDGVDLNTATTSAYFYGNSHTNTPSGTGTINCFVKVDAYSATIVIQTLTWAVDNRTFTRRLSGTTWSAWAESYTTNNKPSAADVGAYSAADNTAAWITPTGANGWSAGTSLVRFGYRKVMGKVQLSMNMTANGAKADAVTMFTLPEGYRPTTIISVSSALTDLTTANRFEIQPDGKVVCQGYTGSQRSCRAYVEYPVEI